MKMEKENNNSSMFYGAGPMIFELAKRLRNSVTASEMLVWGNLKDKFPGVKFRRQHPIALYIVDFYCHNAKLVIEIDGSVHALSGVKENDAERQKYLEELGLKVLRFTNEDVSHNLEGVLQVIEKNIK